MLTWSFDDYELIVMIIFVETAVKLLSMTYEGESKYIYIPDSR